MTYLWEPSRGFLWIYGECPLSRVSTLNRLLGLVLLLIVALEMRGRMPVRLVGRAWGFDAGFAAGVIGGAIGTPSPPVIVYATTQGWAPRAMKANVTLFLLVNQVVILVGYWRAGLITGEVITLAANYAAPGIAGACLGAVLFGRIDASRFRQVVFTLLFASDPSLLENDEIYFNAARLDRSMVLKTRDYVALANPRLERIAANREPRIS